MMFNFEELPNGNLTTTLVMLGILAVLMISYGVRLFLKGRAQYARVDKQGGSALLNKGLMEMGYWGLQPIARLLVSLGVTANMISWTSLAIGLLAGLCLSFGHFGFGAGFAMVSFFMDSLDGIVARMTQTASDSGEILDTTIDRYVEAAFLVGLIIYYRPIPALQFLAIVALVGSYMVSYSSAWAMAYQFDAPKGSMRRPERAVILTLGALLSPITIPILERVRDFPIKIGHPMVIALGLVAVMANFSAIERMWALAREIRRREAKGGINAARPWMTSSSPSSQQSSVSTEDLGGGTAPANDPVKLG